MARFALLTRESSNRVYSDRAPELLAAELAAIVPKLHAEVAGIEQRCLGNVPYVIFNAPELDDHDRFVASNLSSVRALFEVRDDALVPLPLERLESFDDDLITIQRYPGKTNEQFTHMLVNLTLAASASAHARAAEGERVCLLDPVAGRGTTLNRALMYGFDAWGIERNEADVEQYRTFIIGYLKDHRIKHSATKEKVRKGPVAGTSAFAVTIRSDQQLRMSSGRSAQVRDLFPGRQFDLIVGDLPYGVQHRAAGEKSSTRSSEILIGESVSAWRAAMRPGAALGLSWNRKTMARTTVVDLLEANRLHAVEHPVSFQHVVDRSITRDLIVATR
ncbi:MAG: hypothetical protein R2733_22240 [Acidimicrobiales bacterium]